VGVGGFEMVAHGMHVECKMMLGYFKKWQGHRQVVSLGRGSLSYLRALLAPCIEKILFKSAKDSLQNIKIVAMSKLLITW